MKVVSFQSVDEIMEDEWNAIVARNHLIRRHEYLKAVEASKINDCRYFYPVVYDDHGKIAAHACVYFISTELDSFATGALKEAIAVVRKLWKSFLVLRSMECGTPVALGNTISYREGTDKLAALRHIVEETERVAERLGVKVVLFRDFYDEELGHYDQLKGLGYIRINNLPCSRMEIKWASYEEYINSLRSEYRNKTLARTKALKKGSTSIDVVSNFAPYASDLARLWRNVYDNATEYRREMLLEDFFKNIQSHLSDRSAVIMVRLGGQPIGFMLLFIDDETLIPIFCGLDYEHNKEYAVYFNLFYKAIEFGISNGMKDIDLGITTLGPKLEIGGVIVPLHMYMKHFNPLLSRIIPRVFAMMTPNAAAQPRRVFRQP